MILVIAVVFGLCFAVDKGFTKLFRSKVQHQSGKSVRLSKRYGSIGLIMFAFGVAAVFMGINNAEWVLVGGAALLVLGGIALVTYSVSFGIFYDDDSSESPASSVISRMSAASRSIWHPAKWLWSCT